MNLPPHFSHNIRSAFGKKGSQWLADLPSLLDLAAQKWGLVIGEHLPLSFNYVTAAKLTNGTGVVLKIGVPNREISSEMVALRYFNGDGCVRMLESDDENYMFLLEKLNPGEMLTSLNDDEQRTHIACDVLKRLWRPAPEGLPMINLSEWFSELKEVRTIFDGGTGPFPKKLFERAETLIPELFAESHSPVLIHGDFHHFNILSSGRGWIAIDPKGVKGPPEYDCGPLLINPWDDFLKMPDPVKTTGRRIAILSERLGFPRNRIRDWGMCHAILSAFWDLAQDGTGGEYSMACAEIIANATI